MPKDEALDYIRNNYEVVREMPDHLEALAAQIHANWVIQINSCLLTLDPALLLLSSRVAAGGATSGQRLSLEVVDDWKEEAKESYIDLPEHRKDAWRTDALKILELIGLNSTIRHPDPRNAKAPCSRCSGLGTIWFPDPLGSTEDEATHCPDCRCVCTRCDKYEGCPNKQPDPPVPGYEGICHDCRTNTRHVGFDGL